MTGFESQILTMEEAIDNILELKKDMDEKKKAYDKAKKALYDTSITHGVGSCRGNEFESVKVIERMANKYFKPTEERTKAIETLLNKNVKFAISVMNNQYHYKQYIPVAFEVLMNYPEELIEVGLGYGSTLSRQQRRISYEKHKEVFLKYCRKSLQRMYKYCLYFADFVGDEEKNVLIERIVGGKMDKNTANNTLKNIPLSKEQKDRIEAVLLYKKLRS